MDGITKQDEQWKDYGRGAVSRIVRKTEPFCLKEKINVPHCPPLIEQHWNSNSAVSSLIIWPFSNSVCASLIPPSPSAPLLLSLEPMVTWELKLAKSFSRQVSTSEELFEMSRSMARGCTNCSKKAGQVYLNWFLYPTSKLTVHLTKRFEVGSLSRICSSFANKLPRSKGSDLRLDSNHI